MIKLNFKKALLALALSAISSSALANAWDDYKAKYLQADGAIVDTYNHNKSHSEGQSYGLMFSCFYDDKDSFDKILNWTDSNLKDKTTGLYSWTYEREGNKTGVTDKNNATDGDLMIAYALLRAGKKWGDKNYTKRGEEIAIRLLNLVATNYAGYNVLLPGVKGFYYDKYVIINNSYTIYPALDELYKTTHMKQFRDLMVDGKRLLNNLQNQNLALSPDWVKLYQNSENLPAEQWPPRFSYDAIRVPLYLYWQNRRAKELQPYKDYWSMYSHDNTPAWVDVVSKQTAPYPMSSGLKAVRDLVTGTAVFEPNIKLSEDYYNASLSMLAYMAYRESF